MATNLAQAERDAARALHVLSVPGRLQAEEPALVAALIVSAHQKLRDVEAPAKTAALLARAIAELRDHTDGFTDPDFLRASKAARRQAPELFASS